MHNGKLGLNTHSDATSAESMPHWYACKTNWNGVW